MQGPMRFIWMGIKRSRSGESYHRPIYRKDFSTSLSLKLEEQVRTLHVGKSKEQFIAYRQYSPHHPTKDAGIIFCQGLMSNMNGIKAKFLDRFCRERGLKYICFDYMGHGQSSGKFESFTLSLWKENTLDILEKVAKGPQIIVGSSIGGWIMLLAALENPSKVQGLVGIASAPDLLYQRYKNLPDREKYGIKQSGYFSMPSDYWTEPYRLPYEVITDARKHLLLKKAEIEYDGPVHLIHGMNDGTVPYSYSLKLCEKLRSKSAFVHLIKDGDHRLSRDSDLHVLANILEQMVNS